MGLHRKSPLARALALCAAAAALAAAYGVLGRRPLWDSRTFPGALEAAFGTSFGLTSFLAAALLAAARGAGLRDGIPLARWPFLFLAAAVPLGLAVRFPSTVERVRERYRERYAPPGTGEREDTLPDHYRFLEALSPVVRPELRILAVTDRYPYPDLAYWLLPPRPGARVIERVNPSAERVAAYLRADPSDPGFQAVFRQGKEARRREGILYDEGEIDALLREADVLIALDTALDLPPRAERAGLTERLLEWSPRKYALRRPAAGR